MFLNTHPDFCLSFCPTYSPTSAFSEDCGELKSHYWTWGAVLWKSACLAFTESWLGIQTVTKKGFEDFDLCKCVTSLISGQEHMKKRFVGKKPRRFRHASLSSLHNHKIKHDSVLIKNKKQKPNNTGNVTLEGRALMITCLSNNP